MYIAMNRFRVVKGEESAFEERWRTRESYLDQLPGFLVFHLLRGPEREDHTLYSSHTTWASKEDFLGWTQSEQFRAAHRGAGDSKPLHLGHPEFEGFRGRSDVDGRESARRSRLRRCDLSSPASLIAELEAKPDGMPLRVLARRRVGLI